MNLKKSPDDEFGQLVDETLVESSRPQLVSMENFNLSDSVVEGESEELTQQFYLLKGHTKVGPYTQAEINQLITKKELIYTDLISTNEGKSWIKIFENPYFDRRKTSREDLPVNPTDDSFLHSNLEVLAKLNIQASGEENAQDILAGFAYSHTKNQQEKQKKANHVSMHPIHIVKKNSNHHDEQTKTVRIQHEIVDTKSESDAERVEEQTVAPNGLVDHIKRIIIHIKVLKFYLIMACSLSLALITIAVKTFNDSKVSDLHPDTHSPPSRMKKTLLNMMETKKNIPPIKEALTKKEPVILPNRVTPITSLKIVEKRRVPVEAREDEIGQRDENYQESDPYEQDPVRRRLEPETVNPSEVRTRIKNNATELDENLKEEFVDQ
ncbi:MAG: hypothetical protein U0T83_03490 [Bacteriovoracaceae bacterium]